MAGRGGSIRVVNGYGKDAYTYCPVIIVGAGESGIAMGCQLKEQLNFDQFRIYERQSGLGAIFYSFSFAPNYRWSTFHPPGREIVQYFQDVCAEYGIVDKIQLNTEVAELRYLKDEGLWEAKLLHLAESAGDLTSQQRQQKINQKGRENVILREERVKAKIVCSAAGGLVEPNTWPKSIPGIETFEGDILHSARWDDNVNFAGKNVIVVGTGCSAAQLVPKLPEAPYNAKSVTQLMRSPPWVVPKPQPPFGARKWEKHTPALFTMIPGLGRIFRTLLFFFAEYDFFQIFLQTPMAVQGRKKIESQLIDHMKRTVPEKYHEILTPDYGVGCKRRIFDETWFPSLQNPAIELTTLPLASIQPRGVTLGPGRTYPHPENESSKTPTIERMIPADIIVLANGFNVATWLHPLKIYGKDGRSMHDVWAERGGPQAYMGTAMDDYPNLFIIFGPNTATGHSSVILASENMVNYSIHFIKRILKGDVQAVEIKKEAEIKWTRRMQDNLKDTVWMSGGTSWYKDENDWNGTVYPFSQIDYSLRCMFPKWSDWDIEYTRQGIVKKRIRRALSFIAFVAGIVGSYQIWKGPETVKFLLSLLQQRLGTLFSRIAR
ncbi:MAG: hypothetical protein Q9191_000414 [Dirinaria sp. TL-2023a]